MSEVFIKLLNMSLTASVLAVALLLLKLIFKRLPRFVSVILWSFVAIRLLLPISLQSALSLIPSSETVPESITQSSIPQINSNLPLVDEVIDGILIGNFSHADTESASLLSKVFDIAGAVWIAGLALMLCYFVFSHLNIKKGLNEAVPIENGSDVFICDRIPTPFIFGIIRPRIYMPSAIDKADIECVIAHERAHIARRDHIWKPLAFFLLSVYWFNPVLWLAYVCFARDIESATDEKVINDKGEEIKLRYSRALLNCSGDRRFITACPTAFGENAVKERIKGVLSYKKPAFWAVALSVVVIAAVPILFLTDPKPAEDGSTPIDYEGKTVMYATVADIANGELTVHEIGFVPSNINGDGIFTVPLKHGQGELDRITVGSCVEILYNGDTEKDTSGSIPRLLKVTSVRLYGEPAPEPSPVSDFKYRNNYYGGKTITAYIGNEKEVVVPPVIDGKPVTQIGSTVFAGNENIVSVYLPDTLYSLSSSSFKCCIALKSVRLPVALQTIGAQAFYLCTAMEEIIIPETVSVIYREAFFGCKNLKDVKLPEGLVSLGEEAFADCYSLEYIEIPPNITEWGSYAFKNCGLTRLVVDKDLKKLGACTFYNCYKLEDVTISESTEIGTNCFAECYRVPKELRGE